MKNGTLLALALALFALDAAAEAQVRVWRPWYRAPGVGYGYGYGWGGYGNFSSTPMEGASRGMAEMIRAQGEAAESTARGMKDYEEARSKYLDNKQKWDKIYRERKRRTEAERRQDYDKKRAAREKYLAQKESSLPPRLSTSELDPSTGEIQWPKALMGDEYAALRDELQELFKLGVETGSLSSYSEPIHEKSRAMQSLLKKQIRSMPATDYIAARNFLESLAYEGRYAVG